jgi:hypothetical protein
MGSSYDAKNGYTDLGLGLYFDRNIYAGLSFAVGLATNIPVSGDKYDGDKNVAKAQAFKLAIPIAITYSL